MAFSHPASGGAENPHRVARLPSSDSVDDVLLDHRRYIRRRQPPFPPLIHRRLRFQQLLQLGHRLLIG